ncbi:Sensor protein [Methyloversatilis universalis FAM5]|jgi:signal transduction histidine kinase|uniref:histidine kinase n=1 Tax=Methyloversatilis universalis (strain ATCC BAA-1314 / DSM 25237 / JCM 13912 / CCUG 52030 / FAM5) TaxID=1000565 RepID=F5RBL5_METUF|nr:ATP-binding protein [Methyloversatilis universalis]EGK72037.1 Sensor protein [Methyloversatilis universalis FAM5]
MKMPMSDARMDLCREELMQAFPWPTIMLDQEGFVVAVSRPLPGVTISPVQGRQHLGDLLPAYWAAVGEAGPGPCERFRDVARAVDGRWLHERLWMSALRDGMLLFVEDRSEQMTTSQAELQRDRLASLGFMVAGVCHEISNPLTAVQSMMQMLLGRADVSAEALQKGLRIVSENVRRVMDISRRMVDFSRVGDEPRVPFEIDASIIEAIVLLRQGLSGKAVSVEHFPELGALVLGNSGQLQEVIYNILINAAHAVGEAGRIFVTTAQTGDRRVLVRISDTGPGIPEEVLPRIFEPFFTTRPSGQGTGLGLAIAYEFVREHGGELRAYNNPNGGATFEIDLPAHSARTQHERQSEQA